MKTTPRAPTDAEVAELFAYLNEQYPDWTLIKLFVQTKAFVGCRTADLCQVESRQLRCGRLNFTAEQTKNGVARSVPLHPGLFDALDAIKGPKYLWERWTADAAVYRPNPKKRGKVPPFIPAHIYWGIGNIFADFNRSRPDKPRLRPHDLRRRALTVAVKMFGVDKATKALGINRQTALQYYIDAEQAFDGDEVYAGLSGLALIGGAVVVEGPAVGGENGGKGPENAGNAA